VGLRVLVCCAVGAEPVLGLRVLVCCAVGAEPVLGLRVLVCCAVGAEPVLLPPAVSGHDMFAFAACFAAAV